MVPRCFRVESDSISFRPRLELLLQLQDLSHVDLLAQRHVGHGERRLHGLHLGKGMRRSHINAQDERHPYQDPFIHII